MQECCWDADEGGVLTSAVGPCRLTVATIGGMARFLVHRRELKGLGFASSLLVSGTRPNASVAMAAAEVAAARIAAATGLRPPAKG